MNVTLFMDITKPKQKVEILHGGKGGLGNSHFKGSRNQAPKFAQSGSLGEGKWIWLRLKLIADAGLVGLPNAGKSTLLSTLTKAKPKIASYPFTTLNPNLGVIRFRDVEFVLADVPGLIEGAHKGKGLGDRFLRHAERTKVLVHLVDLFPMDGSDPFDNFNKINHELDEYGSILSKKKRIVVLNKIDLPEAEENLRNFKKRYKKKVFPISAIKKDGINKVVGAMKKVIWQENSQEK